MDDTVIESLLSIASLPEQAMSAVITEHGPALVAEVVLREVVARALDELAEPVSVQWELAFGGERYGYVMTFGTRPAGLRRGRAGDAEVVVCQDLTEVIRALFGPTGPFEATREVRITVPLAGPDAGPTDPVRTRRARSVQAVQSVVRAMSFQPAGLADLAVTFDSDKWGMHWYTSLYERYFSPYRDRPVKILEIGIGGSGQESSGGASLRMWKHYFRRGLVYGLDIYDKSHVAEPRVRVLQGDQGDAGFLDTLGKDVGPFDIVIDDGSHLNSHVITSFTALFPHVRAGGLYVIEDMQTSFWPGWGGSSTDLNDPRTSMGFVKGLVDGLNHQEQAREPSPTDRTVSAIHLHHNIAFVEKGLNTEDGAPAWISGAESALFL